MAGRDVLGLAQTGTSKTAAFVLPICSVWSKGPTAYRACAYRCATRELAEQIHQTIVELGQQTKIRSVSIYGGVSKNPQIDDLKRGVEVVVACPGRLLDLMSTGDIDLSHVEYLVLDEADRMCDMGFARHQTHFEAVAEKTPDVVFSATMPDDIRHLADGILNNPLTVQVGVIAPAETVDHALYPVPNSLKTQLLIAMLGQMSTGRVLVLRALNIGRVIWPVNWCSMILMRQRCRVTCRRISVCVRWMDSAMVRMIFWWRRILPHVVLMFRRFRM